MGVAGGPNILGDENLVFVYDTSDSTSYLGEPTTNYASGDAGFIANIDTSITNVTTTLANGIVGTVRRLTITGNTSGGIIRASLGHNLPSSGIPQGGQSYTISCWIRNSGSGSVAAGWEAEVGGADSYARPDVESGFVGNYASSTQPNTVSSSWTRVSYTYSYNTTKTSAVIPFIYFGNPVGGSGAGVGSTVDFYGFQIELNSHLTQFLPAGTSRSISGSLLDLSPNRYQLTLNTSYTSGSEVLFDGTDDYISIAGTITLGSTFTILSWIKPSTLAGGDYIVYGLDSNGADNWFGINANSVNLFATQAPDVNNFILSGGSITSTGSWYHIGTTINGNTAKVYLNGIEQNSTTVGFTIAPWDSTVTSIGRRGSIAQRYFPGSISTVQTYNRVLLPSEILQNYNAQKSRFNL